MTLSVKNYSRIKEIKSNRITIMTTECAICGAKKGEDYDHFADHVRAEHTPEDVGL